MASIMSPPDCRALNVINLSIFRPGLYTTTEIQMAVARKPLFGQKGRRHKPTTNFGSQRRDFGRDDS